MSERPSRTSHLATRAFVVGSLLIAPLSATRADAAPERCITDAEVLTRLLPVSVDNHRVSDLLRQEVRRYLEDLRHLDPFDCVRIQRSREQHRVDAFLQIMGQRARA